MQVSIVYTVVLSAIIMLAGCADCPPTGSTNSPLAICDALGKLDPYPCVNLGVVASTPVHFWDDPCYAEYSQFRVEGIQLLTKAGQHSRWARSKPGEGFCYFVRHERNFNIIFAPGFNPSNAGSLTDYPRYHILWNENEALDSSFRSIESRLIFHRKDGIFFKPLIPLRETTPEGGEKLLINHTFLEFILELKGVWGDLRRQYDWGNNREAIVLICKTIVTAVDAMPKDSREKLTVKHADTLKWGRKLIETPK